MAFAKVMLQLGKRSLLLLAAAYAVGLLSLYRIVVVAGPSSAGSGSTSSAGSGMAPPGIATTPLLPSDSDIRHGRELLNLNDPHVFRVGPSLSLETCRNDVPLPPALQILLDAQPAASYYAQPAATSSNRPPETFFDERPAFMTAQKRRACNPNSGRCQCLAEAGVIATPADCLAAPLGAPAPHGTPRPSWRRNDPRLLTITSFDDAVRYNADMAGLYRCAHTACLATPDHSRADLYAQPSSLEAFAINALELPFPAAQHVLVNTESAEHFPGHPDFSTLRGLHANYKLDPPDANDVPVSFVAHTERQFRQPPLPFQQKVGLVAWMASNCVPWRDNYVRELIQRLGDDAVHSFGPCVNNRKVEDVLPQCAGLRDRRDESECIMRHYKFYLSFENTREDAYYVTEKFFLPLAMGAVPVYLGTRTVAAVAPSARAYINTADFESVAALAQHLHRVGHDEAAYNGYLQWKTQRFSPGFERALAVSAPSLICRICDKAAAVRLRRQDTLLQEMFAEEVLAQPAAAVAAAASPAGNDRRVRFVIASPATGLRRDPAAVVADIHASFPGATVAVQAPGIASAEMLVPSRITEFLSVPSAEADRLLAHPPFAAMVGTTLGHLAALATTERALADVWTVLVSDASVLTACDGAVWARLLSSARHVLDTAAAASAGAAFDTDVVVLTRCDPAHCSPAPAGGSRSEPVGGVRLEPLDGRGSVECLKGGVVSAILVFSRAAHALSQRGPVHAIEDFPVLSLRMQQSLNILIERC